MADGTMTFFFQTCWKQLIGKQDGRIFGRLGVSSTTCRSTGLKVIRYTNDLKKNRFSSANKHFISVPCDNLHKVNSCIECLNISLRLPFKDWILKKKAIILERLTVEWNGRTSRLVLIPEAVTCSRGSGDGFDRPSPYTPSLEGVQVYHHWS